VKQGDKVIDVGTAESSNGGSQIISVKGMLGKITEQSIITQSGATRNLTLQGLQSPKLPFNFGTQIQQNRFRTFCTNQLLSKKCAHLRTSCVEALLSLSTESRL
jgi:hypothetical protein